MSNIQANLGDCRGRVLAGFEAEWLVLKTQWPVLVLEKYDLDMSLMIASS